jgi:hypothetical protein
MYSKSNTMKSPDPLGRPKLGYPDLSLLSATPSPRRSPKSGPFHVEICAVTDELAAREEGRTITQADYDAFEVASAKENEALEALLNTAPTTLSGLRAVIEHILKVQRGLSDGPEHRYLETLRKSPLLAV